MFLEIVTPDEKVFVTHHQPIMFTSEVIGSALDCGKVCKANFSCNQYLMFESKKFNNCLNRKLSIDTKGEIKNCPSMKRSFGNVSNTSLEAALNDEEFKWAWEINKDKVKVCKDCEFRYICTDCRAFTVDPDDIYSKPAKCKYDPYTSTWSN